MAKLHDIDPTQIDALDEIDDGQQLALVWCNTCEKWEWHWIDMDAPPAKKRKVVRR